MNETSLNQGNIYIFGEITVKTALAFQYKIDYLLSKNIESINIFINSEGGDVESALSIVDRIALIKNKINVNTIGIGLVASSAVFILLEGTKRFATSNTIFMMHSITHTISDYHMQLEQYMKFHHSFYNTLITDMALKCGNTKPKEIQTFLKQVSDSIWLNIDDAIQLGLVEKPWTN
jgi:ATP-dependent protease ClpP protease subunit